MDFDHVLLIGFGAPDKSKDVRAFLEIVTRGARIPEERLREVEHHYAAIGGGSPYNAQVMKLRDAIQKVAPELPIFVGMRNWHPFLKEALQEIRAKGLRKGIAIVLAPHRSEASFDKYVRALEEAKENIEYEFLPPWFDHPLFIAAQAEQVAKVMPDSPHFLFTAHSIPVEMAKKSCYEEEIRISSSLVAAELGMKNWSVAFQSRSGRSQDPWLEPDVCSVLKDLKNPVIVPIGFINDNAEVLYDLDIEARAVTPNYLRASTVMDHPKFVRMFAELIHACTFSSS